MGRAFTGADKPVQQAGEDPAGSRGVRDRRKSLCEGQQGPVGCDAGSDVMLARRAHAFRASESVVCTQPGRWLPMEATANGGYRAAESDDVVQ